MADSSILPLWVGRVYRLVPAENSLRAAVAVLNPDQHRHFSQYAKLSGTVHATLYLCPYFTLQLWR